MSQATASNVVAGKANHFCHFEARIRWAPRYHAGLPRGVSLRAWLLKHVAEFSEKAKERFHAEQTGAALTIRPYALAVLPAAARPCVLVPAAPQPGTFLVRLASLNADAHHILRVLWDRLDRGKAFGEVERTECTVLDAGSSSESGGTEARSLLELSNELPSVPSGINFRFVTPTAFKATGQDICYVPTVPLIFEGLARRFSALSGIEPPAPPRTLADRIAQAFAQTRTNVQVRDQGRHNPERGFVGECLLELRQIRGIERETIDWAVALSQFARFAGVGTETTRGMGCVEVSLSL